MPLWVRWIFAAIGAAATAASIAWFVWASVRVAEARDWPRAQGIVVATRVDAEVNESSDTDSRGRSRTSVTYSYRPVIAYTYRVGDRRYGSNRIWLADGRTWDNPAEAEAFLADYPVRGPVSVAYNPADPSDAALIVAPPTAAVFIGTAFGLIFLAVAWFVPHDRAGGWPRDRLAGWPRRGVNRARR